MMIYIKVPYTALITRKSRGDKKTHTHIIESFFS